MEPDNGVAAKWAELRELMETIELDVLKNARGVHVAGVRARKGLRAVKTAAAELVKMTVLLDKEKKASKPAKP